MSSRQGPLRFAPGPALYLVEERIGGSELLFLAKLLESGIGTHRFDVNLVCIGWLVSLRRKGGDDFLEARIAAERVPEGEQL